MRIRLLLAGALLPMVLWLFLPMFSQGAPTTAAKSAQLQRKIDIAREKIGRRKGTERVLTRDISVYNRRIDRIQEKITGYQAREQRIQTDLDGKRAELTRLQGQLRSERARLTRLKARLAVAKDALARRLVELYQADAPDLVTVVLNADGFADLLERGEFLSRVSEQDQRVLGVVRDAKLDATSTEARLARLTGRQKTLTLVVERRRDELARVKQSLIDTRVGYDATRAGKAQALQSVRRERRGLQRELKVSESKQRQIRRTLAAAAPKYAGTLPAQPVKSGGGAWIWPVNGTITGVFGEPRPGHLHSGIDIAAPEGTPIRAAADGRVVLTQGIGQSGGYGIYTCVQHTTSLTSCYAHQVRFGTTLGKAVKQGEVIGYVGNTGNSFGAHLHFEARVNGQVVQPTTYL